MSEDHLDKETSVSAELTPTGVKAQSKSRFIAALDRLCGNAIELLNRHLEKGTSTHRARIEGERQLIEAAARYGVERIGNDPQFAERAFQNHFRGILKEQENKDGVLEQAVEDLERQPPSDEQSEDGSEDLGELFLDRFENYAKTASTEELRHRWGRVLAAEIRAPGTFSPKVLRSVDELDSDTAGLFEMLCRYRIGGSIIKCLSGELSFDEKARLVSSGLILDPGLVGQILIYKELKDNSGRKWLIASGGIYSIGVPSEVDIPSNKGNDVPIFKSGDEVGTEIYVLTDVGEQISSILDDHQDRVVAELLDRLASYLAPNEIREYRAVGTERRHVRSYQKKQNEEGGS